MKVEYSKRATSDVEKIGRYYREFADPVVAAAVEQRIREVVTRISRAPQSGRRVIARPGVHVVLLLRYPYKIFYRLIGDTVRIVHIRHTARRPLSGER